MARIEDYAMVGDLLTAGLIGMDGSVEWMCLPHFDSPACFARMLDGPDAGYWSLAPATGGDCSSRRYLGDTLVLESEWRTGEGVVRIIDFMPIRGEAPDLVRIVDGIEGSVPMRSQLRLRFGYGRVRPWLRTDDLGVTAIAGPDAAYFVTKAPIEIEDAVVTSEFTIDKGERMSFVLTCAPSYRDRPRKVDPAKALKDTLAWWQRWGKDCSITGPYEDAIRRSLVTLKGLTYRPTGGIVAAPTTSLPEHIGGSRNWDYRYCWLRDSALTLQSLLAAGFADEAQRWRDWLLRAIAGDSADLQVVYAIDGSRFLPEQELPWLSGYEGSQPVRIGNAASGQLQLDIWGSVLDALALSRNAGMTEPEDCWDVQVKVMEHLEQIWDQPDHGLWEMRGEPQHFTHSKIMCWVAVDRMVDAAARFGLPAPVDRWTTLRDHIHAEVLKRGFNSKRNTFVQAYDSDELDASTLLAGRVGFLAPDDPRIAGTVDAIIAELMHDGFVRRYKPDTTDDGLSQDEGVFLACSFWLTDALLGLGRRDEAVALFERLLDLRNDVGLLSESYDPALHRQVGNTPQAFSHLSLVMTALQLQLGVVHRSDELPATPRS